MRLDTTLADLKNPEETFALIPWENEDKHGFIKFDSPSRYRDKFDYPAMEWLLHHTHLMRVDTSISARRITPFICPRGYRRWLCFDGAPLSMAFLASFEVHCCAVCSHDRDTFLPAHLVISRDIYFISGFIDFRHKLFFTSSRNYME
jgi:hypothetical protein